MRMAMRLVMTAAALLAGCAGPSGNTDAGDAGPDPIVEDMQDLVESADPPRDEGLPPDADDDTLFPPDAPDAADLRTEEEEAEEEPDLPPIRDDAIGPWAWHQQAPYAINGTYLSSFFADEGYAPPAGSEILVGRVVQGVGQPAYQLYDISGSAFSFDFWPASTVKVLACLGALDFLGSRGMTGDAVVTIYYDDGTVFESSMRGIYTPAIEVSSNPDYDRCVEIAGFDRLNETFLSPGRDLPTTVIQRRYGYRGSLRTSPPMDLVEGGRTVSVAERIGVGDFGCPTEGNCANLFELLNGLRRVVLHDEIPAVEKFALAPRDAAGLTRALLDSDSYFEGGATAAFGTGVLIYNKTGFVPDNDILDHGVVVDPATGDRYLVAVSVPEATSSTGELSDLVEHALLAAYAADSGAEMPWQYDAGVPIRAQLDDGGLSGGRRRIDFTIDAPGADRLRLWTDTWPLGETTGGPRFTFTYDFSSGGERLLVIQAYGGASAVGYRAMAVFIPPP
jgi:hypothetical protein